jgi:hypothetical protein
VVKEPARQTTGTFPASQTREARNRLLQSGRPHALCFNRKTAAAPVGCPSGTHPLRPMAPGVFLGASRHADDRLPFTMGQSNAMSTSGMGFKFFSRSRHTRWISA